MPTAPASREGWRQRGRDDSREAALNPAAPRSGGGFGLGSRGAVSGADTSRPGRALPEEEEEAPAEQLNVRAPLDELVEEPQDVGDVGERQHQQGLLQLTAGKAGATVSPRGRLSLPSTGPAALI